MNRRVLFVFLAIFTIQNIPAQDKQNNKTADFLFESSLRVIIPELYEPKLMGFFNNGIGLHYEIIPKIFSPGVYIDVGYGYDWARMFEDNNSDTEENKNEKYEQLGFNFGFRLYNLIELGIINVNTFVGYTFILGQLDLRVSPIIHNPIIGIGISIFFVYLEYSYYISTKYSDDTNFHHIAIGFRLTEKTIKIN